MNKIGCNTLYDGGELGLTTDFCPSAIRRSLAHNRELGYQTVEYSHLCHLTLDQARELGAYTASLGMQSWSVHAESPGGFVLGQTVEEATRYLLNAIEVCHAVGARVVVVHAPILLGLTLGDLPDLRALLAQDLAVLRTAQARAIELDVALALENGRALAHWVYVLTLIERLVADQLDADHLGVCVDTGHANLGDLGAPRAIRMAGPRLLTLHLHDNWGEVDDHLPPGRGTIDWPDVMAALREVGYARPLQLELTDRAPHREYDQALEMRQGYENTRRMAGLG
jgi:sugar phosphate isomerase/epimerase